MKKATSLQFLDNYKIQLKFNKNEKKVFDMKPFLNSGKYQELKDKKVFESAKIVFDSLEWSNGLDIDPHFLYKESSTL